MENECDFGISRYQLMYFPLFRLHLEEMTSLLRVRESLYGFSFSLSLSSLYTKTFLFECQNLIGATMTSMPTTLFCLFFMHLFLMAFCVDGVPFYLWHMTLRNAPYLVRKK